jgi:hypothetical protein
MTEAERQSAYEQLRAEGETKIRRARALHAWLRHRVLRRDPSALREIAPRPKPTTLRIVEGCWIELIAFGSRSS